MVDYLTAAHRISDKKGRLEDVRRDGGEKIADGGGVDWRCDDDVMKWAPVCRVWMIRVCVCCARWGF